MFFLASYVASGRFELRLIFFLCFFFYNLCFQIFTIFHLCSRRTKPLGTREQDARRWNQGQENLIIKSCLDCEIYLTDILEKCTNSTFLRQPGTKD